MRAPTISTARRRASLAAAAAVATLTIVRAPGPVVARGLCCFPYDSVDLGAPSHRVLPPRGIIFATANGRDPIRRPLVVGLDDDRWELTEVAPHVHELAYDAADELGLDIEIDSERWTYTIDPGWRPPAEAPHLLDVAWIAADGLADGLDNDDDWFGYFERGDLGHVWLGQAPTQLQLILDEEVAAVRVLLVSDGVATSRIVAPAYNGEVCHDGFPWTVFEGPPQGRASSTIILGNPTDFTTAELRRGGTFLVTAIRHDGSEAVVDGVPGLLQAARLPEHRSLLRSELDRLPRIMLAN